MRREAVVSADSPAETWRPSRIDRFFLAVERMPGPPSLAWAVFGLGLAAAAQGVVWASGQSSVRGIDIEVIQAPLVAAVLLGLTHVLIRVSRSAFEDFRPALADGPDVERDRRQLTSIPDRVGILAMVISAVVVLAAFLAFVEPELAPRPPIVDILTGPLWVLAAAAAGLFIAFDARQLRAVSAMSRAAPHVDIFDPTSSNAFARLTVVSSVTLLALMTLSLVTEAELPLAYLAMQGSLVAVAIATFVLPLRAMHGRLEQEKERLLAGSTARVKTVFDEIDRATRARDFSQADQLDRMLHAVLAERELLQRLHTWPWSTTTFRGFASALLLPIVIFVITRVIERFF